MALKLERDVFHNDLLSYLTTDLTNAKNTPGYPIPVCYFISHLDWLLRWRSSLFVLQISCIVSLHLRVLF